MSAGELLLAATNVEGPFAPLRLYIVTCACRLPDDPDTPYMTQVHLSRERRLGESFTALIGDHKRAIEVNGFRCPCLPDREKFAKLRRRFEDT